MHVVGEGAATILDSIVVRLSDRVQHETDIILDKTEKRAMNAYDTVEKRAGATALYALSGFFFICTLFFFLVQHIGLSLTATSLIISIFLLIVGLILHNKSMKR